MGLLDYFQYKPSQHKSAYPTIAKKNAERQAAITNFLSKLGGKHAGSKDTIGKK